MATGSGKTVVMAMLIAWQALNKRTNPQDARFVDTFLIITPGITIRDRLRVLMPNDPENYYRQRDIVPSQLVEQLGQAKIVITNYHAFQPREKVKAGKITKDILSDGGPNPFTESPDEMVRRVCREIGTKKNIIVLNDEAHHCYRRKPDGVDEALTGEDRVEAKNRDEEARIWISGIEAVEEKIGVKAIYDLSATKITEDAKLSLSTAQLPTKVQLDPIVGVSSVYTLDDLKHRRINEVAFWLAKLTLEKYFRNDEDNNKPWLFPQLLGIAKRWLAECVTLKDNTFPQLLLLIEFMHDAADRIYKAIIASSDGEAAIKPILRPYDTHGSTRYVDFDTTWPVFATREDMRWTAPMSVGACQIAGD